MSSVSAQLRIGLAGALGRMGRAMAAAFKGRPDAVVTAAFDRPGTDGQRVGGLALGTPDDAAGCDVVIDFSTAAASAELAAAAAARGGPALVIGSTGWTEADEAKLRAAVARIPVVRSGN